MVSDFIQKNVTILRIVLIITMLVYYLLSTLHAEGIQPVFISNGFTTSNLVYTGLVPVPDGYEIKAYTPQKRKRPVKVVLDAGHGGHDSGAVGKNSYEKDIALSIVLKTAEQLRQKYPDVEVLLTRSEDVFIPLFRRIQYANEQNADLFISVHCNFIKNPKTRGTETFVMGLHRADENLEVAKRENASILLEQNYEQNYEGFDPNSAEGHIMLSMYQNAYLDKSIEFAANVEAQFSSLHLSKSRGVKQAGFAVLRRSSMPAVLVEAGFLSNEIEETFLLSSDGQQVIAESLIRAFHTFYTMNLEPEMVGASERQPSVKTDDAKNKVVSQDPVKKGSKDKEAEVAAAIAKHQQKINTDNEPTKVSTSVQASVKTSVFKVQIAAFKNEVADMDSAELRSIGTLTVVKSQEFNKYLVGDFLSRESAEVAREKLKILGYSGAFIVSLSE